MPDGRVQRIDQQRDTVYIVRRGRAYAAPLAEVDRRARVPGARVRFDLVRRRGDESAANVRLRTGTRSNHRQRRFGDLTGAKRPGAKVDTAAAASGIDVTTQPFRVVRAWLHAVRDRDVDGATALYLPEAVLHTPEGAVEGRHRIGAELDRSPLCGAATGAAHLHGVDRFVVLDWPAAGTDHTISSLVDRGAIVEQWIDVEPSVAEDGPDLDEEELSIAVVKRGPVPAAGAVHAEAKLSHLVERVGRPVRYARVKLTRAENPAVERPCMVEAVLELDRLLVRAHSAAPTFAEAVDLVVAKLAARLEHQKDRRRHRPDGLEAQPGAWRHGNLRRQTGDYVDRPREERELVRHKSFAPAQVTVADAAWDMAQLDYDFFLFVEAETGDDSLLVRDDGRLALQRRSGGPPPPIDQDDEVRYEEAAAPEQTVAAAIDWLDATGDAHRFFTNRATGRANVAYRRFDGHYGLITPPES